VIIASSGLRLETSSKVEDRGHDAKTWPDQLPDFTGRACTSSDTNESVNELKRSRYRAIDWCYSQKVELSFEQNSNLRAYTCPSPCSKMADQEIAMEEEKEKEKPSKREKITSAVGSFL
jgi:hypothetical protein